jgi:colanic acid/amylovoran biosynthesis protein
MHPQFILYGNGSLLNRGCEAIFRSTVEMLRAEFGAASFVYAPNSIAYPQNFAETDSAIVHVPPVTFPRFSKPWIGYQFQRLKRGGVRPQPFDAFIGPSTVGLAIGGDNYTLDYGDPSRFFEMDQAFLRRGRPAILWGASVGPFAADPRIEAKARRHLSTLSLILARELRTVEYLASIGVRDNVAKVADPAFLLEATPCSLPEDLAAAIRSGAVGINLSPILAKRMSLGVPWEEHAATCVLQLLRNLDVPLVLVPHVFGPGANDDLAFLTRVHSRLGDYGNRCVLIGHAYTAAELKWIISQLSGFVGARTHATIAALSSAVPTVSIAYSQKAYGLNVEIFGSEEWVLPIGTLDPMQLVSAVERMLNRRQDLVDHLRSRVPEIKSQARRAARLLRVLLEDRGVSGV